MNPNLSSRFQSFDIEPHEEEQAKAVNPYTFAFIQNKIASYANQAVDFEYEAGNDLTTQVIAHEKLKACVQVLEELLRELNPPLEATPEQANLNL